MGSNELPVNIFSSTLSIHWIYHMINIQHCSRKKYKCIYKDPLLVVETSFRAVFEQIRFDAEPSRKVT